MKQLYISGGVHEKRNISAQSQKCDTAGQAELSRLILEFIAELPATGKRQTQIWQFVA